MFQENNHKRIIVISFYILLAVLCSFLFFKYLLKCILPFILAFILSYSTRRLVVYLNKKFKFTKKFSAFVITMLVITLFFILIYFLLSKAVTEFIKLSNQLTEDNAAAILYKAANNVVSFGNRYLPDITAKVEPILYDIAQNLDTNINRLLKTAMPYIGKAAVSLFSAFPSIFLFTGVTILGTFYFSCDYERVTKFIKLQIPEKRISFFNELYKQFFNTVIGILRAYGILVLMTFLELLVGFILIGFDYAILLAAFISVIDVLPVLGTGTVLVPWSVISFILGNVKIGLCILILYVIITIIRQIAEPKILGDSVGLHPLVTLISMYSGIKLLGVKGLFLFPLIIIIIKNLNEKGYIKLYKNYTQH